MRKKYDKAFKSKVAIEALRGENTLQEISATFQVHPNMIAQCKKELVDKAETNFEKKGKDQAKEKELEVKVDSLYKQIGILQVEKEFLKKKYRQVYGREPDL
ncbi:MAG TPA: hypothetical protein GXZ47_10500 [Treponema sp.]|nr:hypothetical protein [Treponema sp.]HKM02225.1 hypothetical protein [Sedimentibacter sp.]